MRPAEVCETHLSHLSRFLLQSIDHGQLQQVIVQLTEWTQLLAFVDEPFAFQET